MNKHYFRVIFSKTLQRLIVVSELAKTEGKAKYDIPQKQSAVGFLPIFATLKPLTFRLFCALGFVFSPSTFAETLIIKADPNAPKNQQPIVLQTANGLPQVNIQTPNNKGLSHNKYQDFNVDSKGAILNNSHKATQTQQAGWVQGNPYLARGEAKVILNEVTSTRPSQLKGYIEVAGKKAEVIIANPNGLHCDGCGTINATRSTMTTGKPLIEDGRVAGFQVEKGKMKVSGRGLDNSRVDYTDILAQEAEINAGIWAGKKLNVVTGKNTIKQAELANGDSELQITRIDSQNLSENTPHFALDVSELGGMYAGKIHLVGTEQGLGVRNAGHIGASADSLVIDSQGKIVNQGILSAAQQVNVKSQLGIENTGRIETKTKNIELRSNAHIKQDGQLVARQGNINAEAKNTLSQAGTTLAQGNIHYQAAKINTTSDSLIAAGVITTNEENKETHQLAPKSAQGATIDIQSENIAQLAGQQVASGKLNVSAQAINLDHSKNNAYGISLHANNGDVTANHSQLSAVENLKIFTPKTLSTQHSQLTAQRIQTTQKDLNMQNAQWQQLGSEDFRLNANTISHQGGTLSVGGNLNIDANNVDNTAGRFISSNQFTLRVKNQFNSTQGLVFSGDNLSIESGNLINDNGLIQSIGNAVIDTKNSEISNKNTLTDDNSKGIIALGELSINSHQIDNTNGFIGTDKRLNVNTNPLNNAKGTIIGSEANFNTGNLNNENGTILANKTLMVVSNTINNVLGVLGSQGTLSLDTQQTSLNNQQGQIFAKRAELNTGEINNQQGLLRGDEALTLNTHYSQLDNRFTQQANQGIIGLGEVSIDQVSQLNNTEGRIATGQNLTVNAQSLLNTKGNINGQQNTVIQATQVDNREGIIWGNDVNVTATEIDNQTLSAQGSLIGADNQLTVNAQQFHNQQTKATQTTPTQGLQGKQLQLNISQLNNQNGGIYATENLSAQVEQILNNQRGEILGGDTVSILSPQHQLVIDNQDGLMEAGRQLNITAKTLLNEGNIKTAGNAVIQLTDDFTLNHAFQIGNNLTFSTEGNFVNNSPLIVGNQARFTAKNLLNNKDAELSSKQTLINSETLTNYGLIDGTENIIKTGILNNLGTGKIYGNHLAIQAGQLNNLNEGDKSATIAARETLDLGIHTLVNKDHSLILSLGNLSIGGKLDENNQAVGNAVLIDNGSATIEALGDGDIRTERLFNHDLHIKTGIQTEKEYFEEHALGNSSTRHRANTNGKIYDGVYYVNNGSRDKHSYFRLNNGKKVSGFGWYSWWYNRTTETTTLEHSDPGKILIGGSLHLSGKNLHNQYSQLLIGDRLSLDDKVITQNLRDNLSSGTSTLINEDLIGNIDRNDKGTYRIEYRIRKKKGKKRYYHYHHNGLKYEDVHPTEHFNFNLVLNEIGSPVNGTGVSIASQAENADITLKNISTTAQNEIISGQVVAHYPEQLGNDGIPTIKTHLVDIRLPQASLYQINPDAPNGYLVETDPRFTDRKQWLSSDYMFNALRYDHENVQKRLGDGYYEQRLVNEQIHQLTGRRFLDNHQTDYEQYKALMDSGIYYAKKFNLIPGVGLTAEQMAELTSDMVWFVNKEIALPSGKKLTVLTPQVYLISRNLDVSSQGALISAREIVGSLNGELTNTGTIAGRNLTALSAQNLNNQGLVLGDSVNLLAEQKLVNLGGKIEALRAATLVGKTGVEIASTTSSRAYQDRFGNEFDRTNLDNLASIHVKDKTGKLIIYSPQGVTTKGAVLNSAGEMLVEAKQIDIGTINTKNKTNYNADADNYYRLNQQQEVGSQLNGVGNITLASEQGTVIHQGEIHSESGNINLSSNGNIRIEEGRNKEQLYSGSKGTTSGFLSKTTIIRKHAHNNDLAEGSIIDGKNVTFNTNKGNLTIQGSSVIAENNLIAKAKNIRIQEAENRVYSEDFYSKQKSGLMGSGGGIGFTVGSKKDTTENDQTKYYATGSQVGSLKGDTTLLAQEHYQQRASTVSSVDGNVNIGSKKVDVLAADDKYETHYKHTMEQKGFTIAVNIPVVQAVQNAMAVVEQAKQVGESKHSRVNAMAAANTAWGAYRAGQGLMQAGQTLSQMANGNMAQGAMNASVSITYGEQKNVQTTDTQGNTAANSAINAGGEVTITATGAGKASDINIVGSDVSGKQGTILQADDEINLLAVKQTHQERSKNKSSGFNAGVAVSYGSDGFAFGITAGGNYGKGYGNGDETTWRTSHIGDKGSHTIIQSGGDTNIKGAQVRGNGIMVDAENLNIESLQDTMTYKGKQMNVSGQVTVGYGFSGSASFNQSKMNADYASVQEQSGLFAGDEGYQVNVRKHTDLKGGLITSTAQAEADNKNSFSTGSLSYSDIQNHANTSGSAFGVSGSVAMNFDTPFGEHGQAQSNKQAVNEQGEKLYIDSQGNQTTASRDSSGKENKVKLAEGLDSLTGNLSVGFGYEKESQSSVTKSGINTTNLHIRDENAQQSLTGKSVEETLQDIKTDITTESAEQHSGKLANHFDKDKVLKELNIQVKVTKEFRQNAFSTIDAYVLPKQAELRKQIKEAKTEEEKTALYNEIYKLQYQKRLLETVVGIVSGSPDLAITQGTLQLAATKMREETLANSRKFKGIIDAKTGKKISNVSYDSGYFDGVKLGGVRVDVDAICGSSNERCTVNSDGSYQYIGGVSSNGKQILTLKDAIDVDLNPDAKDMYGPTGGFQAIKGGWYLPFNTTISYEVGSFSDRLVESFAGTHDLIGGQAWGFYNSQGNTAQKTATEKLRAEITTTAAIPAATPFAVADLMSSDFVELLFQLGGN
ncbi:hemagglutinin repeat-containing protein [Avibacterium paragallinarum]|uniref:two-partner secretion domain-containing protein n=1 Tax=Avibacterium paragallinarum TaxID=728 RepID=UPI001FD69167|nr:hemagglutinin repeat-containing protein [Avibacterium paragallinarum]